MCSADAFSNIADESEWPCLKDTYRNELLDAFHTLLARVEVAEESMKLPAATTTTGMRKSLPADSRRGRSDSFLASLSSESAQDIVTLPVFLAWVEIAVGD